MTRLRGGSVSPPDDARASAGVGRRPFNRSKLPPNSPEIIVQNTVDITDPEYVLSWHRDERRRQFNLLVRRYKHQILYGCQDPNCRTPTCLSYQKRVAEGPFRRYTELSARTLACYLASLDNPESGLCRNTPRLSADFPPPESVQRPKRRISQPDARESPAHSAHSDRQVGQANVDNVPDGQPSLHAAQSESKSEKDDTQRVQEPSAALVPAVAEAHDQHQQPPERTGPTTQKMKDPKSFTQNLFDTLSLRMVEWLPLRRTPESFDPDGPHATGRRSSRASQEAPKSDNGQTGRTALTDMSRSTRSDTRSVGNSTVSSELQTPSSRSGTSQPAALELKLPGQPIKRLSLGEMEPWRQSPRSGVEDMARSDRISARKSSLNTPSSNPNGRVGLPSPPALKHRPQKHRGLEQDLNGTYFKEQKKHRRVSWDGSKLLRESERHEDRAEEVEIQEQCPAGPLPPEGAKYRPKNKHKKHRTPSPVQTVTHLSSEIVDGLSQMLIESDEDARKWKDEVAEMNRSGQFEDIEWQYATPRQRQVFPFVAQSVFYGLSSTRQLLRSFRSDPRDDNDKNYNASLNVQKLESALRKLLDVCPWDLVLNSLWNALERLFVPPKELSTLLRSSRRLSQNSISTGVVPAPINASRSSGSSADEPLSDTEAAHIATVTLFALVTSLPKVDAQTWRSILQMRAAGTVLPDAEMRKLSRSKPGLVMDITDKLEHELALRLVSRLVRALTARLAFHEISKARSISIHESKKQRKPSVLDLVLENLRAHYSLSVNTTEQDDSRSASSTPAASALIVEWLRTLFLKEWDGKPEMPRSSAAGGAVQILSLMYKDRKRLGLAPEDFHTSFLSERLDPMDMPVEWLGRPSNNKTLHLLSSSFLFPPSALVTYFRAMNYATMSKSYEAAMTATRHVTRTAFSNIPVYDDVGLLARLRTSMTTYLVLVVRRDNVLTDALNQLWRREKRELMRPLKVQMGMDEGEEGVDHGGVQQEFFRVVFGEALNPAYGMFTVDPRTHIAWFQPCALEPLYKYELLGLLMSLAIYNGLTLPVNFPIALYRKLLGLKVKHLDHIRDGWPELAKGLEDLLTWEDGDVGDVFMRTYEFSFEAFGSVKTVDMQRVGRDAPWPVPDRVSSRERARSSISEYSSSRGESSRRPRVSTVLKDAEADSPVARESFKTGILKGVDYNTPLATPSSQPPEEASLVTNENREQFVKDYIFWLTDKSIRPQYEAFARGFYTCLDRTALSIFTPEALKTVVEGIQEIDIDELERHARYEGGFGPSHPMIQDFWQIVKQYPPEKKAQLLEFVTASDRVPVNGISSIMFVIQKNGVGDARLPTSLTCFGRLLLPEYTSRTVMHEKLDKALENARGFGVA
ncbi:hypothetical protein VTN77DRAFT_3679 [Rasamsonia byssochlamydoides]|uniref:uncharacterized protein n=1 Tax=Rasamsonia byssochlamydoides TaxID=89139 RepID=UPI00374244C4